ncbi:hypothetical protein BKA70DRAFT_777139 [Coprinopsis sp. MPI-PUGE-AT-0042]|nr:hypothetical protein BKA70DRAFT_777139 [Coprinopsis sp. MPI-PUGE-AT-0042]
MASVLEDVPMSDDMDFEDDVEAELEVDELDPSDDEQQPAAAAPPKGKSRKASTSKPGVRVPGHTLLPAARVESMLQSSGITNSALGMSKEGQFMLSIATEEFIKLLAKHAYEKAKQEKSNMVRYEDVALVPLSRHPEFTFLQDVIPRPVSLKYALDSREQKLQELLDQDPAVGGCAPEFQSASSTPFTPADAESASTSASASTATKSKKSKASTNGKEKQTNGSSESASGRQKKAASAKSSRSASASSAGTPAREEPPTVKLPSRPSRKSLNGLISASHLAAKPAYPSPLANGHVKSDSPNPDAMDETPTTDDVPRTHQPLGPGSGFLGQEFASRSASVASSTENPGRTIYSQTTQPD